MQKPANTSHFRYSVLIPSCSDGKILECIRSLLAENASARPHNIVAISDGLSSKTRRRLRGVRWVKGKKPFVFAEAINAGARAAAAGSDLVILGDDVRFATPDTIDTLARASAGASIVAPEVIGLCGQSAQRAGATAETAAWLAFICAYIPRRVWDAVGGLDERFTGYGYDDVDWCKRAAPFGEARVAHDVTVRHLDASSFRSNPNWTGLYRKNQTLFEQKWVLRENTT
jgi:GT2 family glycosyltransferase